MWVTRVMGYSSYDVTNGHTVGFHLERACLGPSLFAALDYIYQNMNTFPASKWILIILFVLVWPTMIHAALLPKLALFITFIYFQCFGSFRVMFNISFTD